jgi:hypothetical protein
LFINISQGNSIELLTDDAANFATVVLCVATGYSDIQVAVAFDLAGADLSGDFLSNVSRQQIFNWMSAQKRRCGLQIGSFKRASYSFSCNVFWIKNGFGFFE